MADQDDAANAPLIQEVEDVDSPISDSGNPDALPRPREIERNSPTAFIWALTFTAGISGLLFGYESVMSPSWPPHQR